MELFEVKAQGEGWFWEREMVLPLDIVDLVGRVILEDVPGRRLLYYKHSMVVWAGEEPAKIDEAERVVAM